MTSSISLGSPVGIYLFIHFHSLQSYVGKGNSKGPISLPSVTFTYSPSFPGTQPFTYNKFLFGSIFINYSFIHIHIQIYLHIQYSTMFITHMTRHLLSFESLTRILWNENSYLLLTCLWPVEPKERWETLTPCEAPKPAKPHRLITPWKPFPYKIVCCLEEILVWFLECSNSVLEQNAYM